MSISKNEIKQIKSLSTKKGRKLLGKFPAEGVRLLEEAHKFKVYPEILYYCGELLNDRGKTLVGRFQKKCPCLELSPKQIEQISETTAPQGITALFKIPPDKEIEHIGTDFRKLLWCDNISDPGNLGTLLRSALAFGFDKILLSGSSAEIHSPKVVRSSMGAVFALEFFGSDENKILDFLQSEKIELIATVLNGEDLFKNLKKLKKISKLALAVGSEPHGLSADIIKNAGQRITITQSKAVESLNAAVAGSIVMSSLFDIDEV